MAGSVTHGLDQAPARSLPMPTTPRRSQKTLQEVARVFGKLASELTSELNQAIREIENLRREVNRLKTGSRQTGGSHRGPSRKTSRQAGHSLRSPTPSHPGPTHPGESHSDRPQSHHETPKQSHEPPSSFVFPKEPFSTETPEPSPSGNN